MTLDTSTLSELKSKLEAEKVRLEAELERLGKPTGTPGDYATTFEEIGPDPDENATEVENYADNLAVEDNLEHQLSEVVAALERIERGTYGICEKTGEPIPTERLRAYPAARTKVGA